MTPHLHDPYLHGLDLYGRDCSLETAWITAQSRPGQTHMLASSGLSSLPRGVRKTAHKKVILNTKILPPGAGEMVQGLRRLLPKWED